MGKKIILLFLCFFLLSGNLLADEKTMTYRQPNLVGNTTDDLTEGATNLYYTDIRVRGALSETITGIDYNNGTGVFSLTAGYEIPTTTKTSQWDTAYGWGDHSLIGYLTAEADTWETVLARGAQADTAPVVDVTSIEAFLVRKNADAGDLFRVDTATGYGHITIGGNVDNADYYIQVDGHYADGFLYWMEDEDYWEFKDDVLMTAAEKIYFRDTAIYIHSANDGYLDLEADTAIRMLGSVDMGSNTLDCDSNTVTLSTVAGTVNASGASLEIPNTAGDVSLSNAGQIAVDSTQKQLVVHDGVEKAIPLLHTIQGQLGTGDYDADPDVFVVSLDTDTYPDGIVITEWEVDCNEADPTTELAANLNYCDDRGAGAFPGASATLIDVITTTTGNSTEATMSNSDLGSGVIPAGKELYITITADPTSDTTLFRTKIHFYIPES